MDKGICYASMGHLRNKSCFSRHISATFSHNKPNVRWRLSISISVLFLLLLWWLLQSRLPVKRHVYILHDGVMPWEAFSHHQPFVTNLLVSETGPREDSHLILERNHLIFILRILWYRLNSTWRFILGWNLSYAMYNARLIWMAILIYHSQDKNTNQ